MVKLVTLKTLISANAFTVVETNATLIELNALVRAIPASKRETNFRAWDLLYRVARQQQRKLDKAVAKAQDTNEPWSKQSGDSVQAAQLAVVAGIVESIRNLRRNLHLEELRPELEFVDRDPDGDVAR